MVDFGESYSSRIEVYTLQGQMLTAANYEQVDIANLVVEDYTGMIIIRVKHKGQTPLLKRAIILQ